MAQAGRITIFRAMNSDTNTFIKAQGGGGLMVLVRERRKIVLCSNTRRWWLCINLVSAKLISECIFIPSHSLLLLFSESCIQCIGKSLHTLRATLLRTNDHTQHSQTFFFFFFSDGDFRSKRSVCRLCVCAGGRIDKHGPGVVHQREGGKSFATHTHICNNQASVRLDSPTVAVIEKEGDEINV